MRKRRDEEEIDIRSKMMFRIEVVGRDREVFPRKMMNKEAKESDVRGDSRVHLG
jgi:hypothetical protein